MAELRFPPIPLFFDLDYYAFSTPKLSDEQRERIEREEREKKAFRQAVTRLWDQAASEVRVRHPDPAVGVRISVRGGYDTVVVRFVMDNLRDTSNPDFFMEPTFAHRIETPFQWPGYDVARAFITAGWVLYMMHEGMELVTMRTKEWSIEQQPNRLWRKPERPVIDAHDSMGSHQKTLVGLSNGNTDLASTIDWALGLGNGRMLIERNAERAARELAAEIDPWIPGT